MASFITIDADTDASTALGWQSREQLLYGNITPAVGMLIRCQGPQAVRATVVLAVGQPGVAYLMGVSHGTQDTYSGFGFSAIYQVGQYAASEVFGHIVHWTACETAVALGPDMIAQGAAAFLGYTDDILFPPELGQILFDCDAEIDRALLIDRTTAGAAYQRCIDRFNLYIAQCQAQGSAYYAQCLASNRDLLQLLGNPLARIP